MTVEDIIKNCNAIIADAKEAAEHNPDRSVSYEKGIDFYESVVREVERNIPAVPDIKVVKETKEIDGADYTWRFLVCKKCGEHIGLRSNKYCTECGTKIDWSEIN